MRRTLVFDPTWSLSQSDSELLLTFRTTHEIQTFLTDHLNLPLRDLQSQSSGGSSSSSDDIGSRLQYLVVLDFYTFVLKFCLSCRVSSGFGPRQCSALFGILRKLFVETFINQNSESAKSSGLTPISFVEEFKSELIRHSVERPPWSIEIFSADDILPISEFVIGSVAKYFRSYAYAFWRRKFGRVESDERAGEVGVPVPITMQMPVVQDPFGMRRLSEMMKEEEWIEKEREQQEEEEGGEDSGSVVGGGGGGVAGEATPGGRASPDRRRSASREKRLSSPESTDRIQSSSSPSRPSSRKSSGRRDKRRRDKSRGSARSRSSARLAEEAARARAAEEAAAAAEVPEETEIEPIELPISEPELNRFVVKQIGEVHELLKAFQEEKLGGIEGKLARLEALIEDLAARAASGPVKKRT